MNLWNLLALMLSGTRLVLQRNVEWFNVDFYLILLEIRCNHQFD